MTSGLLRLDVDTKEVPMGDQVASAVVNLRHSDKLDLDFNTVTVTLKDGSVWSGVADGDAKNLADETALDPASIVLVRRFRGKEELKARFKGSAK